MSVSSVDGGKIKGMSGKTLAGTLAGVAEWTSPELTSAMPSRSDKVSTGLRCLN